jgi:hypothetical protein
MIDAIIPDLQIMVSQMKLVGEWMTHDAAGFFTLWLVIVGGGQLVLFYVQLRLIRESLDGAKIAANAAISSAQTAAIQAEISRGTLKTMQDTAEHQLRAYIFVTGIGFDEQDAGHERFIHKFRIENTGVTPAYKLRVESLTRPQPHPLSPDFDFAITPPGRNPSVMMLGPGQRVEHHSLADESLSPIEMFQIKREESGQRLYTFGAVRYEDAFGRERVTNFCYFLEWEIRPNGYAFNVHPSEQHNDAN